MPRAFELYVLRQQDWEIESIFQDRDAALSRARDLHQASPRLSLRIIDEMFEPETGEASSQIIYQAAGRGREPADNQPRRNRTRAANDAPVAAVPAERQTSFAAGVTLRVLGVGAGGFLLLTALSYLPKILH